MAQEETTSNMKDLSAVAELLDEIARDRCDVVHVGFDFARHERSPGGDVAEAVLAALQLQHAEPDDEGRPAPAPFQHPWGPREAASPDVIAVWEALLDMIQSRAVRARLHDLLWIDRAGEKPFLHARAAIKDYIAATKTAGCDALYRAFMLARALELCRQIKARDLVGAISTAAQRALTAEIERRDVSDRPGVSVRLLELLTNLPDAHRPNDLSSRLGEIHTLLEGNHPHDREAIFQLEQKLARDDSDEVVRLQRSNVRVWVDWALAHEGGAFRRGALGMALERANNIAGAEDLREDIRLRMQESGDEDLGLGEIAVESEMPAEQLEELADYIVGDDGVAGGSGPLRDLGYTDRGPQGERRCRGPRAGGVRVPTADARVGDRRTGASHPGVHNGRRETRAGAPPPRGPVSQLPRKPVYGHPRPDR